MQNEHEKLRTTIIDAVKSSVSGVSEDQLEEQAQKIAECVMDEVCENFRSLSEVDDIIQAVQAGHSVQIAYYDPDEDDADAEYIYKACYGNQPAT